MIPTPSPLLKILRFFDSSKKVLLIGNCCVEAGRCQSTIMDKRTGWYRRLPSGLTLVELLTVIAILALFVGALFPVSEKVLEKARRAIAAGHLRQVALAYTSCVQASPDEADAFGSVRNASDWASVLARLYGLNDAELYFVKNDPAMAKKTVPFPKFVGRKVDHMWIKDEQFAQIPLSVVFIAPLSPYAPPSTTPLAYTRGLDISTGEWRDGVYGDEGGFVVFLDGHVQFFTSLKDRLVRYGRYDTTSDIREAVHPDACAFDWKGRVW
jgi:prepilin-type N-terminal cleavage/methylation domain-containing protein